MLGLELENALRCVLIVATAYELDRKSSSRGSTIDLLERSVK